VSRPILRCPWLAAGVGGVVGVRTVIRTLVTGDPLIPWSAGPLVDDLPPDLPIELIGETLLVGWYG